MIRELFCFFGFRVQSGPFKGMRYLPATTGSALPPKLMGVYEKELHPVIFEWMESGTDLFIDIGAAEGYYAVGMAVRLKALEVIAFEASSGGRANLRSLCEANRVVERVRIRGFGAASDLLPIVESKPDFCLMMDIEGGEYDFFTDELVDKLRQARLLIEIHGSCRDSDRLFSAVESRFCYTHTSSRIYCAQRSVNDLPGFPWRALGKVFTRLAKSAMDEKRTACPGWLVLAPKSP